MYIYQGRQLGYRDQVEIYALDMEFHRRLVRRSAKAPSDDWEPNLMLKKRDFQEINPPRTIEEFYATYNPAVGWGTGIGLGSFLFLILFNVAAKWIYRKLKRSRFVKRLLKKNESGQMLALRSLELMVHEEEPHRPRVRLDSALSNNVHRDAEEKRRESLLLSNAGIHVQVISPTPSPSQKKLLINSEPQPIQSCLKPPRTSEEKVVVTKAKIELQPLIHDTNSKISSTLPQVHLSRKDSENTTGGNWPSPSPTGSQQIKKLSLLQGLSQAESSL